MRGAPTGTANSLTSERVSPMNRNALILCAALFASACGGTAGQGTDSTAGEIRCKAPLRDCLPPSITIASPTSGETVSGTVSVSGTASDNVSVASIDLQVDISASTRAN